MPKNIIICCDGTSNKLSINECTNVVYLYSCIEKSNQQIAYYNPGVGTLAPTKFKREYRKFIYRFSDMFYAKTLNERVKDAYIYLMNHYKDGDQIYLFGFSRGAYTVRMLASMIELYGILHIGNMGHLEYIFYDYSKIKADPVKSERQKFFGLANRVKFSFARHAQIRFMGIWDTVVSLGNLTSWYRPFPYTESLSNVKTIRHALAIDERRKHYKPFRVIDSHTDLQEVWFAGAHSDIGGSYAKDGLSKISLEWMLGEASHNGLAIDKAKVDRYLYGKNSKYHKPNFKQNVYKSHTLKFKIADFIPRPSFKSGEFFLDFSLWPKREINEGDLFHSSVIEKINYKENNHTYDPSNIPKEYSIVYNLEII